MSMYHSDVTNLGTFRGKHARLNYDPEVSGGTLTIQGPDWSENIRNSDIAAVIKSPDISEDEEESYQILLISSFNDEASDPPGVNYHLEAIQATNLPQPFIDANSISPTVSRLSNPQTSPKAPILYIIISTLSGTGQAQQYFDNIIKPVFATVGIQPFAYYVHTTYSDKSVSNFATSVILPRANEGIPQTILLLSGDGGIVDIVNAVLANPQSHEYVKPAIGLIAMGTGNAFANSTGLNRDATKGLRHFLRGKPHSIPTFTVKFSPGSEYLVDEGRKAEPLSSPPPPSLDTQDGNPGIGIVHGAVVCSWALHASLVADSDTTCLRKHGSQRFQMAAKELLTPSDGSPSQTYKGKITLFKRGNDEQGTETTIVLDRREHMYILATLVSNLEEKLTISPSSKPLDGQLRLLYFEPISAGEVMRILGLAFQGGGHVGEEVVGYEDVEGVRIDFEEGGEEGGRWRRVCVDGKIVRVGEGGWVEVRGSRGVDVLDVVADL